MAAATRTSVGASAPNAMRPSPVSVTSPAATHLPVLRQRPSGTIEYRIPTSSAANSVTWSDGIPQPPQPAPMATPKGRGRWAKGGSQAWTTRVSSWARTSTTIRCRKRRSTSNATSSPASRPLMTHQELRAARARQAPTSPGAWSPTSHRTTASSTTVTSTARPRIPRAKTTIVSAISTTPTISHRTPLVCRW